MTIKRDIYLKSINPFVNKGLIKVFTGQRRVGKSEMLKMIAKQIEEKDEGANFIFIDKEDYKFDEIKNYVDLMEYVISQEKGQMNILLIDEVQEIESFERALRSLYKKGNFDIYCTGSNADLLSGELSIYLSGRQIAFRIGSLTFNEFCNFHKCDSSKESLIKYLKIGGLPFLMHLPDDEGIRYEYLKNIYSTILFRDIVKRHQIRDPRFLTDLIRFLADNVSSIFSANSISKYLKSQKINKNVSLILNYISYIEEAYFINAVKRVDIKGKRQFEIGVKYYFEDIGLRNITVGFKMQDIEKIIENVVFLHLRNNGYELKVGVIGNKEIDFVATKDNERIYVQVAYLLPDEKTIQREFGNLLAIGDNYPKYVVSYDSFPIPNTYQGIKHFTLLEFLTSFV